ncbi:putative alpha-galactosidase [Clostridium neonatale]|uniref:alpha-galactosidase n=1 Tax=Clostridium neonatale TaxID=137838 RepID=UPI00291C0F1C|nr:putative alpha-galactosidase [Clostridium neonatale]CAI3670725.1 putative alpha-galactosidase [Clostridium neonatale]CAI3730096.1 putative alpha-galactosidase [Clostridium neonatale]CAI3730420.1 putative alpha-galactosidase [Clostridium neonatale]CAI3734551.1 putative alpha-galactosidase [Clostridium neonatale]
MGIRFNEQNKLFNIESKNTSYILNVLETGHIAHLYWGRKINSNKIDYLIKKRQCGSFLADLDNIDDFHLEAVPQEYPSYGNPDLRSPAIQIKLSNGTTVTDFRYYSHKIFKGKNKLQGLPATYVENDNEAETLEITLNDSLANLKLILSYTVFEEYDAITRNVKVINDSNEEIDILRVLSANVDFNHSEFDFIQLSGAWARERHIVRTPLRSGGQCVESRRGASSHAQNPFMALVSHEANEDVGDVYGFNLIYSGNFLANVEVDMHNNSRAQIGINPFDFTWNLESKQEFQTPEVVMAYSPNGLTGMSHIYHDLYRERLVRGSYRDKERPILINNWEATYFDFDNEKIKEIAKEASDLGIELFVLDDGWFGERNSDDSSLGDWFVNENKIKCGLNSLVKDINDLGMKFGLWFEPEMISPNSNLYREHPDWCIHIENRTRSLARKQLVLDLSRDEVCDAVIKMITDVLKSAPISYVKWDMNRNITELGSPAWPPKKQKELAHRYMLGLYKILENITSNFPDILFESCSGGGGRFDGGMLYYMPQTWTSDDTDAIERLKIQEGTSLVYPSISMGSHVSAVPNHQVNRITPLSTRGIVAMAGSFGYELDVTKMTDIEKEEVKKQIELYKSIRKVVQFGDLYRLKSPFKSNEVSWITLSKDKEFAIVSYVKQYSEVNKIPGRLKLKALDENSLYEIIETKEVFGGDELMYIGLEIGELIGDYVSKMWTLKKCK